MGTINRGPMAIEYGYWLRVVHSLREWILSLHPERIHSRSEWTTRSNQTAVVFLDGAFMMMCRVG